MGTFSLNVPRGFHRPLRCVNEVGDRVPVLETPVLVEEVSLPPEATLGYDTLTISHSLCCPGTNDFFSSLVVLGKCELAC